ncbi:hypothetical protein XENOCAPTIV_029971 [Xenoophorus captivus]|uniref:Uncharacterized protein n=1 Tax=Xenoophorus captivus TaxID=1517983 RepID=A0ABV0QBS6_9TELE
MNYSKAQMVSVDAPTRVCYSNKATVGVKLETVMEQLQKHQGAKLEMNMQEKHLLQAQFLLAQQAAAARASDCRPDSVLFGKADEQIHRTTQHALRNPLNKTEPKQENEDSDREEQEMLEPEDGDELENEGDEKKIRLPLVSHFQPYSTSLPVAMEQMSEPSPSAVKEEQEEKNLSPPAGQTRFTSPNGLAEWGYDELFKQVCYTGFRYPKSALTFILLQMSIARVSSHL